MLAFRFLSIFSIVTLIIFTISCASLSSTNKGYSADLLVGDWVHSQEESTTRENIFRPNNYNFPPARGSRDKMTLEKGGALSYSVNGPNDQPVQYKGTWLLSGKQLVLNYDKKQLKYTIVDISNSILKLK